MIDLGAITVNLWNKNYSLLKFEFTFKYRENILRDARYNTTYSSFLTYIHALSTSIDGIVYMEQKFGPILRILKYEFDNLKLTNPIAE